MHSSSFSSNSGALNKSAALGKSADSVSGGPFASTLGGRNFDHLDYDENLYDFMKSQIPFYINHPTNAHLSQYLLSGRGLEKDDVLTIYFNDPIGKSICINFSRQTRVNRRPSFERHYAKSLGCPKQGSAPSCLRNGCRLYRYPGEWDSHAEIHRKD